MDAKVDSDSCVSDQLLLYKSDRKFRWVLIALVLNALISLLSVAGLLALYASLQNELTHVQEQNSDCKVRKERFYDKI